MGCDEIEIVTFRDLLLGNENKGPELNVRSLLDEERKQWMEYGAGVADALL